jgi:oligogalacturonide transporter
MPANPSNILLIINSAIVGLGLSAGVMIPWAMIPTVIDIDELITSKKRAGLYSGMMTLVRKVVQALTLFLLGLFLDLIGYVPNQPQADSTLFWLRFSFLAFPVVLLISGILISFKYKITPEIHKIIVEQINKFRKGQKDADKNTRRVLENLTGIDYENLYKE